MRALLFRCKKRNWQALTGAGLLDLLFGLLGFGQIKHRYNYVFKGTPSEKKNSQDNLPALTCFSKIFTLHVFLSNLPSKKGRSNVTYPVRVRDNILLMYCSHIDSQVIDGIFSASCMFKYFFGGGQLLYDNSIAFIAIIRCILLLNTTVISSNLP